MIEIKEVSKNFGAVMALNKISFNVRRGEVLGFLGPNGAGKTTTMKIITGFYEPDQGTILLDGLDVVSKAQNCKRKIGYLPETVPLYDEMKVYEYLKFIAEIRDLSADKSLSRIKEVVEICGLQSVIGKSLDELSKGYRQRVGLAQAIMHNPDILILDEPTTGLDPNQIAEIRELIKKIGKEKTVIFSTHILAEAQATCDRVIIINKGAIVAEGSPHDLMEKFGGHDKIYLKLKAKKEQVLEKIKQLSNVISIKQVDSENDQINGYDIVADGASVRESLSGLCLDQAWPIYEFVWRQASLEEVFRDLTK